MAFRRRRPGKHPRSLQAPRDQIVPRRFFRCHLIYAGRDAAYATGTDIIGGITADLRDAGCSGGDYGS